MAYKQPYNSPNLRMDEEDKPIAEAKVIDMSTRKGRRQSRREDKTMKVRINPNKYIKRGGELSSYAKDHITKTNKRGKVTIEVPKSEMSSSKSKLFDTSIQTWTSAPYGKSPSQQPTAKDFKKQRNKDRVMKTAAGILTGIVGGGGAAISALQNKGPMALVEDKLSRKDKKKKKKAEKYTLEVTGVEEKKPFKGYSKRDLRDPNAPKNKNNKNSCGKTGLLNTKFGNCMGAGSWHR